MNAIWKYELVEGISSPKVPKGAKFFSAINQGGTLVAYAIVNPENEKVEERLIAIGTGWPLFEDFFETHEFIATVEQRPYVWHIFRGKRQGE